MGNLIVAVLKNNLEEVRRLLVSDYWHNPRIDEEIDEHGNNALHLASYHSFNDIVVALLDSLASIDKVNVKSGMSAIMIAAQRGFVS